MIFCFLNFSAQNERVVDVGEMQNEGNFHRNSLAGTDNVEDSLLRFQNSLIPGSSQNQPVYGYDHNGNYVLLGVIIDGNLSRENENLIQEECKWVGCEEECISNEVLVDVINNEEVVKNEDSMKKESDDEFDYDSKASEVKNKDKVIKIYKSRGLQKKLSRI